MNKTSYDMRTLVLDIQRDIPFCQPEVQQNWRLIFFLIYKTKADFWDQFHVLWIVDRIQTKEKDTQQGFHLLTSGFEHKPLWSKSGCTKSAHHWIRTWKLCGTKGGHTKPAHQLVCTCNFCGTKGGAIPLNHLTSRFAHETFVVLKWL